MSPCSVPRFELIFRSKTQWQVYTVKIPLGFQERPTAIYPGDCTLWRGEYVRISRTIRHRVWADVNTQRPKVSSWSPLLEWGLPGLCNRVLAKSQLWSIGPQIHPAGHSQAYNWNWYIWQLEKPQHWVLSLPIRAIIAGKTKQKSLKFLHTPTWPRE